MHFYLFDQMYYRVIKTVNGFKFSVSPFPDACHSWEENF